MKAIDFKVAIDMNRLAFSRGRLPQYERRQRRA